MASNVQVHTDNTELPSCPHCFTGHLHSGVPKGEVLADFFSQGRSCYHASPPPSAPPRRGVILYLHDAFGFTFVNNQLLCDAYAEAGFHVYMPDILGELAVDGASVAHLFDAEPPTTCFGKLSFCCSFLGIIPKFKGLMKAGSSKLQLPLVFEAFDAVQKHANSHVPDAKALVGCVGFCFGGKYAVALGGGDAPRAACVVGVHPSRVEVPRELRALGAPALFCLAEKDFAFPKSAVALLRALKGEGKEIEIIEYPKTSHGFACRGPDSVLEMRKKCQGDVVQFFTKHLPIM